MSSSTDVSVRSGGGPTLQRRILIGVVLLGAAVVVYFIVKAIVPRWWAQRVGDVVDGSLTVGALFGVFIGFVFVVIPLLTAWAVIRWRPQRRTWLAWLGWIVVVAVLAAPNLMTLNIVIGNGNGEHAGDRTLDTEAPGFRVWSVIGAIAGIAFVAWMMYLARSRGASRRRESKLRGEMAARPDDGAPNR